VAVLLALSACGSSQEESSVEVVPPPARAITTHADVVMLLHALNAGEVETSQLALQRAQDPRVTRFAQRMIAEHSQGDRILMSVHEMNGGPPTTHLHPMVKDLRQRVRQTVESLHAHTGSSFDLGYMENQVHLHAWAFDTLDRVLIPVVDDGPLEDDRLEQVLEELREHVEAHLRMALEIQGALSR
jgi:predicted outer membrane protein